MIVPSLKQFLSNADWQPDAEKDDILVLLIAVAGALVQINEDYSVLHRADGLYAIGSGAAYAIGALEAGATPTEAVEIASRNDDDGFAITDDQTGEEMIEALLMTVALSGKADFDYKNPWPPTKNVEEIPDSLYRGFHYEKKWSHSESAFWLESRDRISKSNQAVDPGHFNLWVGLGITTSPRLTPVTSE